MKVELRKEIEAEMEAKYSFDHRMALRKVQQEWTESIERREYFLKLVRDCVDMKASDLKARIAQLEEQAEQAKPQPKPKPQPGTAALHKRISKLEEENKALTAKLTKVESLKRARTMQRDRRSRFRNKDNDQENTESPAAKKRDTRNSSSSTMVDNKQA